MPVYFEAVRGLSASLSGLALIPLMAGTVCGATLSGQTMARVKHYKRLPMAGLLVAMAAGSGVDLADVFAWVFMATMAGFGLALAFLFRMEERPLRGSAGPAAEAAVAD